MINKQYQVLSTLENGTEIWEGNSPTPELADQYATFLANSYGPTYLQDIDPGHRVVSITVRPIWILNN